MIIQGFKETNKSVVFDVIENKFILELLNFNMPSQCGLIYYGNGNIHFNNAFVCQTNGNQTVDWGNTHKTMYYNVGHMWFSYQEIGKLLIKIWDKSDNLLWDTSSVFASAGGTTLTLQATNYTCNYTFDNCYGLPVQYPTISGFYASVSGMKYFYRIKFLTSSVTDTSNVANYVTETQKQGLKRDSQWAAWIKFSKFIRLIHKIYMKGCILIWMIMKLYSNLIMIKFQNMI